MAKIKRRRIAPKITAPAKKAEFSEYEIPEGRFTCASPPLRRGRRTSSRVMLDRVPDKFTDRDREALDWMSDEFSRRQFERKNIDGGVLSRLIGHGAVAHMSGDLSSRAAKFKLTGRAGDFLS